MNRSTQPAWQPDEQCLSHLSFFLFQIRFLLHSSIIFNCWNLGDDLAFFGVVCLSYSFLVFLRIEARGFPLEAAGQLHDLFLGFIFVGSFG